MPDETPNGDPSPEFSELPAPSRDRYGVYRSMLAHPEIQRARDEVARIIGKAGWKSEGADALAAEPAALLRGQLRLMLANFPEDALTALDYGFAPFEVIWEQDTYGNYFARLRLIPPAQTTIWVDRAGSFAGFTCPGLSKGRIVDLSVMAHKAACVTLGGPGIWPGDHYGRSRLERARSAWESPMPGPEDDQGIYDLYLGGTAAMPPVPELIAGDLLSACNRSLRRAGLIQEMIRLNFGDRAWLTDDCAVHVVFACEPRSKSALPIKFAAAAGEEAAVVLHPDDAKILRALAKAATTQTQYDLEAGSALSRKTISARLARLREAGLTYRPSGDRGGEAITDAGRNALAHDIAPAAS
jgi:hypothetical protein